jgi:flagellar FliJ protein
MKFRYSLQKIVDFKSNEKTQAEWILSAAFNRLRDEEASLTLLETERQEIQETLSQAAEKTTTVSELSLYQSYLSHIDLNIRNKNADVRTAQQAVNKSQEHLTEKMKQEKVWFMARDKAQKEFAASLLKKEQEALDELTNTRYKRPS